MIEYQNLRGLYFYLIQIETNGVEMMIKPAAKLKKRYSLFSECSCGKNVHIVYDKICCGVDHLQASLNQDNIGEMEWQYHLNKIAKCLHRIKKTEIRKEKLMVKVKPVKQKPMKLQKIKIQKIDISEKPKLIIYFDSIGRLRKRKAGKPRKKRIDIKLRNSVLVRDNNKCVKCSSTKKLHVHHIVPRSDGGEDVIENLSTLCDLCHAEEHRGQRIYNLMVKSLFEYTAI